MRVGFLALIWTCICLFSCPVVNAEVLESTEIVSGEERTVDAVCGTKEELLAALQADAGGTITLSEDIIWDYTDSVLSRIKQPVVIEMGTHKIHIPAGCFMQLAGPVNFRGEGEILFEVEGMLNLSYGAEVLSHGENAVAIRGTEDANLQLFICKITASGTNSTAIYHDGTVTPQLCHISGTKAAVEASTVVLDACSVSPLPSDAEVIERVPTLDRSLRLYGITLPEGVDEIRYQEAIYGYGNLQYAFIDPQSGSAIGGPLECEWSELPTWPVEAGSYTFCVKPTQLPDWFPVEIPSFDIPLHIVGKNVPWLNVVFSDPYLGMLSLQFGPNIPDGAGQMELFYSTDQGQNWKKLKEDYPDSTVKIDFIDIVGLEPNKNYWFFAELTGGTLNGSSNIIYHPNYINDTDVDFSYGGGDRDEDDFGDQGEKPPAGEIIPPAEEVEPSTEEVKPPVEEVKPPAEEVKPLVEEVKPSAEAVEPFTEAVESPAEEAQIPTEVETLPSADVEQEPETSVSQTETVDIVMVVLGLAVIGGIVSILLLRWKGGRK